MIIFERSVEGFQNQIIISQIMHKKVYDTIITWFIYEISSSNLVWCHL